MPARRMRSTRHIAGTTREKSPAQSRERARAAPAGCSSTTRTDRCATCLLDELPSDVRVIFGNRKPFSMVQDADGGFGGAFFIGYHGAAGDADAVLCHTYTPSVIYEVRVNGIRCSEATLNAGLLGFYGVPLLLATGDRTTVEGIAEQMPWVRGVIVKESIGSFAADSMVPAAAQRAIRREAEVAIAGAAARSFFASSRRSRSTCSSSLRRKRISSQRSQASNAPAPAAFASCTIPIRSFSKRSSQPGASAQCHPDPSTQPVLSLSKGRRMTKLQASK